MNRQIPSRACTGKYSGVQGWQGLTVAHTGCVQWLTEDDRENTEGDRERRDFHTDGVLEPVVVRTNCHFEFIDFLSISDPGCYNLTKRTTVTEQTEVKPYPKFTTVASSASSSQVFNKG